MSGSVSVIEKDKAGNGGYGYWGQVGVAIFIAWPESLSDKVTSEWSPKRKERGIHVHISGSSNPSRGQACAKDLRQLYAWGVQGIAKRLISWKGGI